MSESKTTPILARDISSAPQELTLDGKTYRLEFNCDTFRIAEEVYEIHFHREMNFADIVEQLTRRKIGAVMAIFYAGLAEGAIMAGGTAMTYNEFVRAFRLDSITGVADVLLEGVSAALPVAEGAEGSENP